MARMSMRAFLSRAKQTLSKSLASKGGIHTSFVIGNESADLDSITCALVYAYIQSSLPASKKSDKYWIPITNIPQKDLSLRPELTALLRHADLKPKDLITLDDIDSIDQKLPAESTDWTLVDHNVLQGELGKHYSSRVTGVIDHHEDEGRVPQDAKPRVIEVTGSCNSHVINYCRPAWDDVSGMGTNVGAAHGQNDRAVDDIAYTSTWDAHVAKLSLGSILIDTHNLQSEDKTTDHDRKAVRYLEAKIGISNKVGPSYDRDGFFKEISDAKSDLDDLSLTDVLRKDYKQWTEGDLILGIASCVRSIQYIQKKSDQFVADLVDFANSRELDLFAIGTSHSESGSFERQLLLLAVKQGKPVEIADKFENGCAKELQLETGGAKLAPPESKTPWIRLWEQKNLSASRKQVAPLLRKSMPRSHPKSSSAQSAVQ